MKLTLILAAAFTAPSILGSPLPNNTHHMEGSNGTSTLSTPRSAMVEVTTDGAPTSTLEPRQFFPPPSGWSWKTRCVTNLSSANRGSRVPFPIYRLLRLCKIRSKGNVEEGINRIYELCAQEADEEGVSEEDKYMRCEGFKGFGK